MATEASSELRLRWAYVAFFGALWGGVEVTLGSFLHTLRIPFTGIFLASFSALLMIAQRQVCSLRGTTLATGVVAALLKSLSPGGIIVGPMIGITVEALLVELILLPRPRSRVLAIVAGGTAAMWAATQGVMTQFVLYGTALLELYVEALRRLTSWLGLDLSFGWATLLVLSVLIATPGLVAGLLGHRLGRQVLRQLDDDNDASRRLEQAPLPSFAFDSPVARGRRYVFPIALLALLLQFGRSLPLALLSFALLLAALAIWGRPVLRAMWLPRFWLFSLLLALAAGFLLTPETHTFSWKGLEAGGRMVLRGAFLFALFSWMARAVRPTEVLAVWSRLHLPRMGEAIATAFSLLPAFVAILELRLSELRRARTCKERWRAMREASLLSVVQAVRWARASVERESS